MQPLGSDPGPFAAPADPVAAGVRVDAALERALDRLGDELPDLGIARISSIAFSSAARP